MKQCMGTEKKKLERHFLYRINQIRWHVKDKVWLSSLLSSIFHPITDMQKLKKFTFVFFFLVCRSHFFNRMNEKKSWMIIIVSVIALSLENHEFDYEKGVNIWDILLRRQFILPSLGEGLSHVTERRYKVIFLLYTIPMNINGYTSFLINTLETIERWGLICWLNSTPLKMVYLLHATGKYCILLMSKISISFPTSVLVISYLVSFF